MSDDGVDIEILYAAQLGVTLRMMRRDLSEEAIKRVLTFALARWGVAAPALYVHTIATPARAPKPEPEPPPEPEPRLGIPALACPFCEFTSLTDRGVRIHMLKKHGTSWDESARQLGLSEEGGEL